MRTPSPAPTDRFIVTEVGGFLERRTSGNTSGSAKPGLSCHVIDTALNCRVMATFRTESIPRMPLVHRTPADREAIVRKMARVRAAELNADPLRGRLVA